MAHRFADPSPPPAPASPEPESAPAPRPSGGAPRPISILIGKSNQLIKVTAALHEALPGVDHVVCADAAKALEKAETVRHFGWAPAIFVFDYRRGHAGDLADSLRKVREGEPNSELVVLIEDRDFELSRAALQVVQAPDKLTFLMTPFWRPDAVATVRALAERYQVACERGAAAESGSRTILGLESELTATKAKLQIALHAAQHDPLTGILNRTGFVNEVTARLARGNLSQTVLLVDLDRFKTVNDTLGHHAGDDLVRKICSAMAAVMPAGGVLARLGGDEFGIPMNSTRP